MDTPDKLTALSKGIDSLMRTIFLRDRKPTLQSVAMTVHDLLNAESCAIFLVPEHETDVLELVASYTDVEEAGFNPLRLKIHSEPGMGMIGYLASLPGSDVVKLSSDALQNNLYKGNKPPTHLASQKSYSWLSVPLRDRKDRLLGIVTIENKKGPDGQASSEVVFDTEDEAVAKIAGNMIVIVTEHLHTSKTLRGLMRNVSDSRDLETILNEILEDGKTLLAADRADLVLWSETQQNLILAASQGEICLEKGKLAAYPSIISSLWYSDKEWDLIPDVNKRPDYLRADRRTQSELAIVLQIEGRRIGALSMEAFRPNGFNEEDVPLLRLMAQYAAIGVQMVGKERYIQQISERLAIPEREEVFENILSSVKEIYGFEAALIYRADLIDRKLHLAAYIGCENVSLDLREFYHSFDSPALASRVYYDRKPIFVPHMTGDAFVDASRAVDFDIPSAAMGLPLLFERRCVGVLVIWSRTRNHVTRLHEAQLGPFASLAAANLAMADSEHQRFVGLKAVQAILTQMQTELPQEQYLRLILEGIRIAGFDRVRHFDYDAEEGCFIGVDSLGMANPQGFDGYKIFLHINPYARDTAQSALADPAAKLYSPELFGPDPDAERLEKSPQASWAVAPLIVHGRLYGQITADNEIHRRPISSESLENLSLLAALASQAIANSATFDSLRARDLQERFVADVLHDIKTPVHSISNIVHLMLSPDSISAEDQREWLQVLRQQADSLSLFVKQAQDLIRGRQRIRVPERISLRQLVEETIKTCRLEAQKRSLAVELTLPDAPCEIEADPERLRVAFENILDNALKYSPPGATIEVALRNFATKFYTVSFCDSGPGIPEEERTEVFDPFLSIPRSGIQASFGLGLSIAQAITQVHGGRLNYEDRPNQTGACFVFHFPVAGSGILQDP